MKNLTKKIMFNIVLISIIVLICNIKMISIASNINERRQVKVGVLLYNLNNEFGLAVKRSFEDIQKANEDKVKFEFFDGKTNLAVENEIIDKMINNRFDIIFASLVETKDEKIVSDFIFKAKQKNIPVILFNTTPANLDLIKNYPKAIIINTDAKETGILQGKMIANFWDNNKKTIDKNGDNIMQYIMIEGKPGSLATELRTKYSISTINELGIETQELASQSANWEREFAKVIMQSLFLKYGNKIEVIISNNDEMALGAIETLQKYGYNSGNKQKNIPVFGIDAIPAAQDLIKKGFIAGSIYQDVNDLTEALYTVGMNLVLRKNPIEGTNYKLDETGVRIFIPPREPIVEKTS